MDKHSMVPGRPWEEQFPQQLASCDAVVSFFSPHMFPFQERPFIAEQRLVNRYLASNPGARFIPVRLAKMNAIDLQFFGRRVEDLHCVDFFSDDMKMLQIQFERLFSALELTLSNIPRPLPSKLVVRCARRRNSWDNTVGGIDFSISSGEREYLPFGTTKVFKLLPGKCSMQAFVDIFHMSEGADNLGFEVFSKSRVLNIDLAPFSSTVVELSVQSYVTTNTIGEAFLFKWVAREAGLLPRYQDKSSWPEGVSIDVIN